ncbi:hypothetical protein P3T76_012047 [Phytophthora citrophthora]|uniref:Uncharacterized protein n=1 Tax=Phytophthora citrophthora TaxID=4793 RepID=A0AAD9G622_9STRA|nr:hypothetical protein P3T76_012047 [Phytophthora citrophthora]
MLTSLVHAGGDVVSPLETWVRNAAVDRSVAAGRAGGAWSSNLVWGGASWGLGKSESEERLARPSLELNARKRNPASS